MPASLAAAEFVYFLLDSALAVRTGCSPRCSAFLRSKVVGTSHSVLMLVDTSQNSAREMGWCVGVSTPMAKKSPALWDLVGVLIVIKSSINLKDENYLLLAHYIIALKSVNMGLKLMNLAALLVNVIIHVKGNFFFSILFFYLNYGISSMEKIRRFFFSEIFFPT